MIKVKFDNSSINTYPANNWLSGKYEFRGVTYSFQAKVFPNPSVYGIHGGRVSKLWVRNLKNYNVIISYDRGHALGDARKYYRGMIKELIDYLEDFAKSNCYM